SSPYRQMMSASSRSGSRASNSAAVAPLVGSSLISKGPSNWKLNPRAGSSSWSDATPRSARTPSICAIPAESSTSRNWSKPPGKRANRGFRRGIIEGTETGADTSPAVWDASGKEGGVPAGPERGVNDDLPGPRIEPVQNFLGHHRNMERHLAESVTYV